MSVSQTVEEETVLVRHGDVGSPKYSAARVIKDKYGEANVEILSAKCMGRESGGTWRWLVTFNLDAPDEEET